MNCNVLRRFSVLAQGGALYRSSCPVDDLHDLLGNFQTPVENWKQIYYNNNKFSKQPIF